MNRSLRHFAHAKIERLGVALEPQGQYEAEGVLNPGSAIDPAGNTVLYPRMVAEGNESRIGIVRVSENDDGTLAVERRGFALAAEASDECRPGLTGGQGCEDCRVTWVAPLGVYLMGYTKFGPDGPRLGIAFSHDAYNWQRLDGHIEFPRRYRLCPDDKDVAFFPEVVTSPRGVQSIAFFHRPMPSTGSERIESALAVSPRRRQCVRIAYVPVSAALQDLNALLRPTESKLMLVPSARWGCVKVGAGTAPVRIAEGWLVLYHGVDAVPDGQGGFGRRYAAGMLVLDAERPDKVLYRSAKPLYIPEAPEELKGIVGNVVFPTGLVPRGERVFDVYDGIADFRIGRKRLTLPPVAG